MYHLSIAPHLDHMDQGVTSTPFVTFSLVDDDGSILKAEDAPIPSDVTTDFFEKSGKALVASYEVEKKAKEDAEAAQLVKKQEVSSVLEDVAKTVEVDGVSVSVTVKSV